MGENAASAPEGLEAARDASARADLHGGARLLATVAGELEEMCYAPTASKYM